MYYADYHVHTSFSDDSTEPMQAHIERALELGLKEICFTDHVDYGIKKDYFEKDIQREPVYGLEMVNVNYPKYFETIDQMKQIYKDSITLKKGLEFGMQTITVPKFQKLFNQYKEQLDFILLSCHQVDNKEFWNQNFQQGKTQKEYNESYYKEIYNCQKRYKDYCVLAHLDMLSRYDLNGIYPFEQVKDIIAEILKQAISDGKGIEVNTSSFHYQLPDLTPNRHILQLYKDLGGKIITIGSDAHSIQYLADHNKEVQQILKDEFGFKEIYTFEKMKPIAHEL